MSVLEQSAFEVAEAVRSRQVSVTDVTRAALEAIERVEPKVSAYIGVDAAGAMQRAAGLDAKLDAGETLGPLGEHGLDGPLGMALDLQHVSNQPAETVSSLRLLAQAEQVPGSLGHILPATEELRERDQPRAPLLPQRAPLTELLRQGSQPLGGLFVAIQRLAKQSHEAVPLGQQASKPVLEIVLLAIGLTLTIPDLKAPEITEEDAVSALVGADDPEEDEDLDTDLLTDAAEVLAQEEE